MLDLTNHTAVLWHYIKKDDLAANLFIFVEQVPYRLVLAVV